MSDFHSGGPAPTEPVSARLRSVPGYVGDYKAADVPTRLRSGVLDYFVLPLGVGLIGWACGVAPWLIQWIGLGAVVLSVVVAQGFTGQSAGKWVTRSQLVVEATDAGGLPSWGAPGVLRCLLRLLAHSLNLLLLPLLLMLGASRRSVADRLLRCYVLDDPHGALFALVPAWGWGARVFLRARRRVARVLRGSGESSGGPGDGGGQGSPVVAPAASPDLKRGDSADSTTADDEPRDDRPTLTLVPRD